MFRPCSIIAISITLNLSVFGGVSIESLKPGRYDAVGTAVCSNGKPPVFKDAVSFDNNVFNPMEPGIAERPPVFWILDYKNQRSLALGAVVLIDHWNCPDNGHSSLVHRHYSYLSIFKFGDTLLPSKKYSLLGSYASNYYNTHFPYLAEELEQEIENEITFHMKPEIDGAIERFEYYGPKKSPNIRLVDSLSEDQLRVEYDNACGAGTAPVSVVYQRAQLEENR